MNKKGNAMSWVFWILGFLVIISLIIGLIVASNQEFKEEENQTKINLYISAKDYDLKKSTTINYELLDDATIISKGKIERNTYTEISNISIKNYSIYCGGQGYYHEVINKTFTPQEIYENVSKLECSVSKIGKLTASSNSKLNNGEQIINLTIKSESNTKRVNFCVAWTPSIIVLTSIYEEIEKPERYKKITDKCFNLNLNLKDNSTQIYVKYKAENLSKDEIHFYFFDSDYILDEGEYKLLSEYDNENLGSNKDTELIIN